MGRISLFGFIGFIMPLDCQAKSNRQIEKSLIRGAKAKTLSGTIVQTFHNPQNIVVPDLSKVDPLRQIFANESVRIDKESKRPAQLVKKLSDRHNSRCSLVAYLSLRSLMKPLSEPAQLTTFVGRLLMAVCLFHSYHAPRGCEDERSTQKPPGRRILPCVAQTPFRCPSSSCGTPPP